MVNKVSGNDSDSIIVAKGENNGNCNNSNEKIVLSDSRKKRRARKRARARKRKYTEVDDDVINPSHNSTQSTHFGLGETISRLNGNKDNHWNGMNTNTASGGGSDYPSIKIASQASLHRYINLSQIQGLILYLLADGVAPQWLSIRNRCAMKKVVMLMIPGLEAQMFRHLKLYEASLSEQDPNTTNIDTDISLNGSAHQPSILIHNDIARSILDSNDPDRYYPRTLDKQRLAKVLQPLASIFTHCWPIHSPGDERYARLGSPISAILELNVTDSSPITSTDRRSGTRSRGNQLGRPADFYVTTPDRLTHVCAYMASHDQLVANEYIVHPSLFDEPQRQKAYATWRKEFGLDEDHGWFNTLIDQPLTLFKWTNVSSHTAVDAIKGENMQCAPILSYADVTQDCTPIAIDCEMCITDNDTSELTRISVVDWNGNVIMDELVKPERSILDYLTDYSGITAEKLENVTLRLADVQRRLLEIITPNTPIIGHSLNSDLKALKLTHPYIIDTALVYPHPRGTHLKTSLKWLAQNYLGREIQTQDNTDKIGHDSVEDARACLELIRQKCAKGPLWGCPETTKESLLTRLARYPRDASVKSGQRSESHDVIQTAIVDWGEPSKGHGFAANVCIGCESDLDVVSGIKHVLEQNNVDFTWARFRELEAVKGWWTQSRSHSLDILRQRATSAFGLTDNQICEPTMYPGPIIDKAIYQAFSSTMDRIREIYSALPNQTVFIIYSGTGNPRSFARLQAFQKCKKRYQNTSLSTKPRQGHDSNTSVPSHSEDPTIDYDQALRDACRAARHGIAFIAVK